MFSVPAPYLRPTGEAKQQGCQQPPNLIWGKRDARKKQTKLEDQPELAGGDHHLPPASTLAVPGTVLLDEGKPKYDNEEVNCKKYFLKPMYSTFFQHNSAKCYIKNN